MSCLHIDFDVLETNNPKKLMIGDTSQNWLHAENDPAYLYITIAGSRQPKIFTFDKKAITVFNSVNLGLSSVKDCGDSKYADLPDGVYTIKLQSSYEEHYVQKYYLKTDIIELEISKKIVDNALNKSTDNNMFVNSVFEVEWKLKVAKAFIREGNLPLATRYYNEAVDVFKSIK